MKINKPKFWDTKINIFALILLPLSFIVRFIILIKKNFIAKHGFDIHYLHRKYLYWRNWKNLFQLNVKN